MKKKMKDIKDEVIESAKEHETKFDWDWIYKRHEHIYGEVCKLQEEVLTMEHHLRIMDDRWEKVEKTMNMIWNFLFEGKKDKNTKNKKEYKGGKNANSNIKR